MGRKTGQDKARETFRQFAWNLAGTLAEKGQAVRPAGEGKR